MILNAGGASCSYGVRSGYKVDGSHSGKNDRRYDMCNNEGGTNEQTK